VGDLIVPEKRVSIVDDDESVRESLPDLLRSFGFEVAAFSSAEEFLSSNEGVLSDCLVLDVAMPGMSGPELQIELARRKQDIPIIFITSHPDDGIGARVLSRGAVACLAKPFEASAILEAVRAALDGP
jgi:FixJ family two-component response regulator